MDDLPRHHTIRESSHRIINPFSPEKLRQLGDSLFLPEDANVLDLACGKGEMLCTWARDYGIRGTGVDISTVFLSAARERSAELGVSDRLKFVHGNASTFVSDQQVDVACCIGATWIGDGVPGTINLLRKSLKADGTMLVGHPYWRKSPTSQEVVEGCEATKEGDWLLLHDLIAQVQSCGCDVIGMVLADQDSWDQYVTAQWRNIRAFIDANPDNELVPSFREELRTSPITHTKYQREFLGWGVFVLRDRG